MTIERHNNFVNDISFDVIAMAGRASRAPTTPLKTTVQHLIFALCLLPVVVPCRAISNNAGTKNGAFLNIATDARGVALGNCVVSMPSGADAMRWNPAGLGLLEEKEVSATHIQYYQDVHIENAAGVFPIEEGGVGASAFYLAPGSLDGRNLNGDPTGDFKFYDMVGAIGFGRKMLTRAEGADVSIGAELKIVQEAIADQSFQNPAFDIGALASPADNLNLGFSVRNLASSKANFAREMIGGASYTIFRVFTGAFAVDYSNDAPIRYSVGGEYKIPEYDAAVRAGYQSHDSLDNSIDSRIPALRGAGVAGLTMGAGMNYKPPMFPTLRLGLDYAMAPFGALGISHTLTFKVKW
jgi:long-subunit fatty acid transport protein